LNITSTLSRGLLQLCQNDSAVNNLISPRREEIISLLDNYINEIELFNLALGLTGTCDREELVVKHILDSLAPLAVILQCLCQYAGNNLSAVRQMQVADLGSGAGLPGIPLAIALPNLRFALIERMGRRAGFLRNCQAALGLSNVSVEETEMEKAEPGRFALVTFRAFKPLEPNLVKALFRLCADRGVLAAYKGRSEKVKDEMATLERLQPELTGRWNMTTCQVPFLHEERHLVIINKQVVGSN
jgi:16S rRNA (guanine527-N7)-methyltransferase